MPAYSQPRFVTREADRTTYHSFSFGPHYDPGNVGLASLVAHNDDHVRPGGGYPEHPHRDAEQLARVRLVQLFESRQVASPAPLDERHLLCS